MGPRDCLGWPDVWEESKQGSRLAMQQCTSRYPLFYSNIFQSSWNEEFFNTNAMHKCWVEKALSGNYRIMPQWWCFLSRITSQWFCWSARAKIGRSQVQDSWESTWGVVFGFEKRTKMAPEKDQGVPLRGSLDCEAKSGRVGREYNRWRAGERSGRQKGAAQLGRLGETFKFGQSG